MKFVSVVCAVLMSISVQAELIMRDYYIVVSDVLDQNLAPGTCLLTGKTMDVNGLNIAGGLISNFDRSRNTVSDTAGNYSLMLSAKDTSVFFYHRNYGEVVVWSYPFKSQHRVEINFISMAYSELPVIQEKPVIYAYADIQTSVCIKLEHPDLTFTYPAYADGWNFVTGSNGELFTADGNAYPYLFWEGKSVDLSYQSADGIYSGSLINTDSTISFLENSLTALSLNFKERTDFITYWAPRLIQGDYAFVQFLSDQEVDQHVAAMHVTPQPNNQKRIFMLFTLLENPSVPFRHVPQKFTGMDRNGLTVVEWGGAELEIRKILETL